MRVGVLVLALAVLGAGLSLFSTRAYAVLVDIVENGAPGHLSLASDPAQPVEFLDMSPGSVEQWQIAASLIDPSSPLTMQFKRDGALVSRPDGLTWQGQLCTVEWDITVTPATCAGAASNVFGPLPASDPSFGPMSTNTDPVPALAPVYNLGTITNVSDKYLLVTLSIPYSIAAASDQSLMGIQSTLGFGFSASGNSPTPPPTTLANTGQDGAAIGLTALGALLLGLVLRSVRHARSLRTDEGSRA